MQDNASLQFLDELDANERLLWSGRPQQGLLLRPSDAFLIPFSLMWCGFAIFWEAMALRTGGELFFALWGIPFVLVGLYVVAGRFLVDAYQRSKTYYGVTDERILILSGLLGRNTQSLTLKTLAEMNLSLKRNGRGTLTFGPTDFRTSMFQGVAWPGAGRYRAPAFEMIPDAKQVHDLIRRTQREE